jgi:hypothetical protein
VGGQNAFLKFSLDGLLRADIEARNRSYSVGIQAGYLSINDVRRWEDIPSINDPAADSVRVPLANINVDAADLIATEKRVTMAQQMIQVGFDPAETLAALSLPVVAHTGLPSSQLQQVAQLSADDPEGVYSVE